MNYKAAENSALLQTGCNYIIFIKINWAGLRHKTPGLKLSRTLALERVQTFLAMKIMELCCDVGLFFNQNAEVSNTGVKVKTETLAKCEV